jgi:nucleoid-associated protein YgaU
VVVEKGDHLWSISAEHLEQRLARSPRDTEVALYWHQVIEVNRHRLRSGDPDLIHPGETVLLPEAG